MQARPNESAIVNRFVNNTQSTHQTAVVNSVGMAIQLLIREYGHTAQTEVDIDRRYQQCLTEMTLSVNTPQRTGAFEFLKAVAAEPLERWDEVYLYLPNDADNYTTVKHIFSLKLVIPLIWKALRHHDKFKHNYQGNAAAQLTQARADYATRVGTFFSILLEAEKDELCHTGFRNELVFQLNGIYCGVDIIEDALSTIAATLKDHANALFWERYQLAQTSEEKKTLTAALFAWMCEHNPAQLLTLVDPNQTALDRLSALFLRHGSNPGEINVALLMNNCLPTLNFSYDQKRFPVIQTIENIFNCVNAINTEAMQLALDNLKVWVFANATLDDDTIVEKLNSIVDLYQSAITLNTQTVLLLEMSEETQDKFQTLKEYAQKYMTQLAQTTVDADVPVVEKRFIEIAGLLKTCIQQFKTDKMVDFIGNFFARWELAKLQNSLQSYRFLYSYLLDETFHQKVILTDSEIDSFWHQNTTSAFRDITVYQINRAFLHAHIVQYQAWTVKFKHFVTSIYQFIRTDLSNQPGVIQQQLIKSSYTTGMLNSMNNVIHNTRDTNSIVSNITDTDRAVSDTLYDEIFLPHHVRNADQWLSFSVFASDEKVAEVYQPQAVRINFFIRQKFMDMQFYNHHKLSAALRALPVGYRLAFLQKDFVNEFIASAVNQIYDYVNRTVVNYIITTLHDYIAPSEKLAAFKQVILATQDKAKLYKLLRYNSWEFIIKTLPADDRLTFISFFPINLQKSDLCKIEDDRWLALLPETDLIAFYRRLRVTVDTTENITTFHNQVTHKVMRKLSRENQVLLLTFIGKDVCDNHILYHLDNHFLDTMNDIFNKDAIDTFTLLMHLGVIEQKRLADYPTLLEHGQTWVSIYLALPIYKRLIFLSIAGMRVITANATALRDVMANLPASGISRLSQCTVGKPLILAMAKASLNQQAVIDIIKNIDMGDRKQFVAVFNCVAWDDALNILFELLPRELNFDFLMRVSHDSIVKSSNEKQISLSTILKEFSTEQLSHFYKYFGDSILKLNADAYAGLYTLFKKQITATVALSLRSNITITTGYAYLSLVPLKERLAHITEPKALEALESQIMQHQFQTQKIPYSFVSHIQKLLSASDLLSVWEKLNPVALQVMHKNFDGFNSVLSTIPPIHRFAFLQLFPPLVGVLTTESWLSLYSEKLLHYLCYMAPAEALRECASHPEILDRLYASELTRALVHIGPGFTSRFCLDNKAFVKKLASLPINACELMQHLGVLDRHLDIHELSDDTYYWTMIFTTLPTEKCFIFLSLLDLKSYLWTFPTCANLKIIKNLILPEEFESFACQLDENNHSLIQIHMRNNRHAIYLHEMIVDLSRPQRMIIIREILEEAARLNSLIRYMPYVPSCLNLICDEDKIAILTLLVTSQLGQLRNNVEKFSITPALLTLPAQQIVTLVNSLTRADLITLIAARALRLDSLSEVLTAAQGTGFKQIELSFLRTFIKIYNALHSGQTSFFKNNFVTENQLGQCTILNVAGEIDKILLHAQRKPFSRTAQVVALMQEHSDLSAANNDLMNDIYTYSYSHSGLFKRTDGHYYNYPRGQKFYRAPLSLPALSSFDWKSLDQNSTSRHGKIMRAMRTGEEQHHSAPVLRP